MINEDIRKEIAISVIKNMIEDMPPCDSWVQKIIIDMDGNNNYFEEKMLFKANNWKSNALIKPVCILSDSIEISSIVISNCGKKELIFMDDQEIIDMPKKDRNELLKKDHAVIFRISDIYKDTNSDNYFLNSFFLCGRLCASSFSFHFKVNKEGEVKVVQINRSIS